MGIHASVQSNSQRPHLNSAGEDLNDPKSDSGSSEDDTDRTSENQASLSKVTNTTIHGSAGELNGVGRYPAPEEVDTGPLDYINQVWPRTQF